MKKLHKFARLATVLGAGFLLAAAAHAQWGWADKDGRRVFSDQAPGSEVPDKSIFKRPASAKISAAVISDAPAATASAPASGPRAAASGPRISGKDAELEKKKKETEAAEEAKRKAEETKFAEAKAENCANAKKSVMQFNAGGRIGTVNAKGEREIMSDTDRASAAQRAQDAANSYCK